MAIEITKIPLHWNYFLAIESDLEIISRFIEFDESNFECYSIEISRILLSAAAEVDVVCKQICKNINSTSEANNIHQYRDEITQRYPRINEFKVNMPKYGLTLRPWANWKDNNGVPDWWTAYNKIKHHRDSEYARANLKNMLNAVAGLYGAVIYYYPGRAERGELIPSPVSLYPGGEFREGFTNFGNATGINYKL